MHDDTPEWALAMEERLTARFNAVDGRLEITRDDIMARLDRLQEAMEARFPGRTVNATAERVSREAKALQDDIDNVASVVAANHEKLFNLEVRVNALEDKLRRAEG